MAFLLLPFLLYFLELYLLVQQHLAMSVLKWSKQRKRSSDSIYDVLHLVRFLHFIMLFFPLQCHLFPASRCSKATHVVRLLSSSCSDRFFPSPFFFPAAVLLCTFFCHRNKEAVSHRCVAECLHHHKGAPRAQRRDGKISASVCRMRISFRTN